MNETIKDQIKQVQDYFKSKLLTGDFEITGRSQCVFTLSIDGCTFHLWTGNYDIPETRGLYSGAYNFIDIPLTQKERIKLHSVLRKDILDYENGYLLEQKRKLFEKLKRELNELETKKPCLNTRSEQT